MIRYLGQEEYGKCLPLWQEAFPEDSQAFLGYYFNKKLPGSRVLVKEDGSGSILTMAHLNPYTVMVRRRRYRLSYIVGVATAASSRHPVSYTHLDVYKRQGGYSISVNDLYLTDNSIVINTELKGPEKGENAGTEQSFPFIVIKTEYLENPVVFQ